MSTAAPTALASPAANRSGHLGQLGEQGLRAMGELGRAAAELSPRRRKLLGQPGAQALRQEVADIAFGGIGRPVHRPLQQRVERPGVPELADVTTELPRVRRRHRAQREDPQQLVRHIRPVRRPGAVRVQQVGEDVPGTGGGERLLVPGRRGRQVVRPLADVVDDPRVNAAAPRPGQPVAGAAHQVDVHHPVDQRRGHRPHDGRVLAPVSRPDHHGLRVQRVVAEPPVQDQAVERLLYLMA